jgi:hypothetical protein
MIRPAQIRFARFANAKLGIAHINIYSTSLLRVVDLRMPGKAVAIDTYAIGLTEPEAESMVQRVVARMTDTLKAQGFEFDGAVR